MTKPKDLAELGARGGVNAIGQYISEREALAVVPPPTGGVAVVHPSAGPAVTFNELVDLEAASKVPPFPLEALPDWIAEWVEEAAWVEQVPLDIPATLALAAVSVVTMGKAKVDVFGGEPLNGYFVMVDRPGANKSGILKRAIAPLWNWWTQRETAFEKEYANWKVERDVAESKVKQQGGRLRRKSLDAGELGDIKHRLEHAYGDVSAVERSKPKVDLRLCQDVTPERMGELMMEARCVATLSAEGKQVFDGLGRYQSKGENMEVVLQSWGGDHLIVDRKNGTKIRVESPTLAIVAMAQPKVLERLRDPEGERDGRGLLARFFWCVPQSMVGYRVFGSRKWNEPVRTRYEASLSRLFELAYPSDGVPALRLTPCAFERFGVFFAETERELRPGGDLADIEAAASKIRSHLARVAGWLHLAGGRGFGEPIDGPTMERAEAITRYFLAHTLVAYRMMEGPDDDSKLALRLFHKARKWATEEVDGCQAVALRDLAKKVKSRTFPDTAAVEAKLRLLEANGYTKTVDRKPKGKIVLLNPEVPESPEGAGLAPAASR